MKTCKSLLTPKLSYALLFATLLLSCKDDDPAPVNEEELITTVIVALSPVGGGDLIELKFYDADGAGAIAPVVTPAIALLNANKTYDAAITLLNESVNPKEDITEEIEEEADHHLFCFTGAGTNVTIGYDDEDSNGHPVGLNSSWTTGEAGSTGEVTVTLRHQPENKTGECPGGGDTDVQVKFAVQVI